MSKHLKPKPPLAWWKSAVRVTLSFLLITMALLIASAPDGRAVGSTGTPTSSAVTVKGTGDFADLEVTVDQTRNLINQVIGISWKGARPTQPEGGLFGVNYLQVMQCWGDEAGGPDRSQCQFGGRSTDSRGGAFVATRQLSYGSSLVDPLEPVFAGTGQSYAPFRSVTGKVSSDNNNEFFDNNTTNELPFNAAGPDGTGNTPFEVQTSREAPGLGCGEVLTARQNSIRDCWLVIVPRGDREVDGSVRSTASNNQITSSPLSLTNWAQRLVVPLRFAPLGQVCPLGRAERRTVGAETVVDAVSRWQPVLCRTGPVYGFSQVPDEVARRQLTGDAPGLAFVTRPLPSDSGRYVRYAPVALSGLAFAFDINRQVLDSASDAEKRRNGERLTRMKLTPRLVAKLLTQSYRSGALAAPYLRENPSNLLVDPDFLALNPEYAGLAISVSRLMVPAGNADTNALVWQWIAADQDAADFVAGAPDPWGARVNPFYQGGSQELTTFPKSDPYCQRPPGTTVPLCTFDAYPYGADLHEITRAASRGDSLARDAFDRFASPPSYKKGQVQPTGQHALLTLSDTVAAARYGLPVAEIRNGAGQFVDPDTASLNEGLKTMVPSVEPQVLRPNPASNRSGAYPLAVVTYAATAPGSLTLQEARDYGDLIRYAISSGQVPGVDPGQLPAGFAPVGAALTMQAQRAASDIVARRTPALPAVTATSTSPPVVPVTARPVAAPPLLPGVLTPLPPAASAPAEPVQAPVVATSQVTGGVTSLRMGATPAIPAGPTRYILVIALLAGGLCAGLGPLLPRWVAQVRRTT